MNPIEYYISMCLRYSYYVILMKYLCVWVNARDKYARAS
jgi:hypothetical protein